MKLSEYMETLKYLTLYTREEGLIEDAVNDERKDHAQKYRELTKILFEAIKRNRDALGLYKDSGKPDAKKEAMQDSEILGHDLKTHVALVRNDVLEVVRERKLDLSPDVVESFLMDFTRRAGVTGLGKPSSRDEKKLVAQTRKAEARKGAAKIVNSKHQKTAKAEDLSATPLKRESKGDEKTLEDDEIMRKLAALNKPYNELTAEEKKLRDQTQKALEARLRAAGKIL